MVDQLYTLPSVCKYTTFLDLSKVVLNGKMI